MYERRWIQLALWVGLLWFLAGIAWVPTNKLYEQGVALTVWLPALIGLWGSQRLLRNLFRENPLFCSALLAWIAWAALSMCWTSEQEPLKHAKRIVFALLFLVLFPMLQAMHPQAIRSALRIATPALALAALWSMYLFFYVQGYPFGERLVGIGQLSHPILGGYVMALAAVWGFQCIPHTLAARVIWAVALAILIAFVLLTQSRGACLALLFCTLSMPAWSSDRKAWLIAGSVAAITTVSFLLFKPWFMQRGVSYRPEIFAESVRMIMQHPWIGLGIGTDYRVVTDNYPAGFDHSHNLFTHVAIQFGLVGLLLWLGLWLCTLIIGWRERGSVDGRLLLSTVLVASFALQFDAASIWGKPKAEWFLTWLPIGLALALVCRAARAVAGAECNTVIEWKQAPHAAFPPRLS